MSVSHWETGIKTIMWENGIKTNFVKVLYEIYLSFLVGSKIALQHYITTVYCLLLCPSPISAQHNIADKKYDFNLT